MNSNASSRREKKFIRAGLEKEKSRRELQTTDETVLVKPFGFWMNCARSLAEPALRCLRIGGRQVAIASTGDRRVSFDLIDFYHNLSRLIGVDRMKFTPGDVAAIADELRLGFEAGALKAPPFQLVPFENASEAYDESPAVRQKQSRCSPSRSFAVSWLNSWR